MTTATAKPARRYLQFRLRTLFVLVVIAAIPCVWLKSRMDRKAMERAAVAEIVKIGGNVYYDWQVADEQEPPGAAWLRKLFGEDFFSKVIMVDLAIRGIDRVTDEIHMQSVSTEITDDWLVILEPLTDLEDLQLAGKQISDSGLVHLVELTQLKELCLSGTGVTDAGLVHLNRLKGLEWLAVDNSAVTSSGIVELQAALPNCEITR